jgi:hypothetical protein
MFATTFKATQFARPETSRSARYLVKCRCGFVAAFNASRANVRPDGARMTEALLVDTGEAVALSNGFAACTCGRELRVARVEGRVTDHACGPKCRTSKGPRCDCACGGKNHGAGYPLQLT